MNTTPFERNRNTARLPSRQRASSVDLRHAYGLARELALAHPAAVPGYRLVWVRNGVLASTVIPASNDGVVIIGRHTRCGVVLPDDPFVALRHLLVRSIVLPSGDLALRVLDLRTALKFSFVDGSTASSIVAEGPLAFSVGEYAIIALPTNMVGRYLPGDLPVSKVEVASSPYRANARLLCSSRITLMPRPVVLGEATATDRHSNAFYLLTLQRESHVARTMLTDEQLLRGVLIGRDEKCYGGPLRRVVDIGVSRVHLLLIREGMLVWAYDLASTQGTYVARTAMARYVLPDAHAELQLGRTVRLTWRRLHLWRMSPRA